MLKILIATLLFVGPAAAAERQADALSCPQEMAIYTQSGVDSGPRLVFLPASGEWGNGRVQAQLVQATGELVGEYNIVEPLGGYWTQFLREATEDEEALEKGQAFSGRIIAFDDELRSQFIHGADEDAAQYVMIVNFDLWFYYGRESTYRSKVLVNDSMWAFTDCRNG